MEEENKEENEMKKLSPDEEFEKISEICKKLNYVFEQTKSEEEKEKLNWTVRKK